MSEKRKYHRLCLVLPEMPADQFAAFKASMANNGFDERHPIVMFRGEVLDGRHRLRASDELIAEGIPVVQKFVEWVPPFTATDEREVEQAMEDFILAENLHRRHLSLAQYAQILIKERVANNPGMTLTEIHNETGISRPVLSRALTIERKAPEMAEAVIQGTAKPRTTYNEVRDVVSAGTVFTKDKIESTLSMMLKKVGEAMTALTRAAAAGKELNKQDGNGEESLRTLDAFVTDLEEILSKKIRDWAKRSKVNLKSK